jgi:uncharacterized protein (TIGR02466 family)
MLYDMFSTPIWHLQLADAIDNEGLTDAVHQQRQRDPRGTQVSNLGGWQSGIYLHREAPFDALSEAVVKQALRAADEWGLDFYGHAPELNTMWANVNRGYDSNFRHHHWGFPFQNFNFLSGSYYVRCSAGHGAIKFIDERPSSKFAILEPFIQQSTKFNSNQFSIQPQAGDLVLFPSWLEHMVSGGTDQGERISIAFNLSLPRGLTDKVYLRDRG